MTTDNPINLNELDKVSGGSAIYYGAYINPDLCLGSSCGFCETHCPARAIIFTGSTYEVIRDECLACETCVMVCPADAVKMMG